MQEILRSELPGQEFIKPCQIIQCGKTRKGYGKVSLNGERQAHRASYKETYGEIPKGLYVCHRCDVRDCIEPTHLFLGTQADNMKDMVGKGRSNHPHGIKNGRCKLTSEQVLEIYNLPRPIKHGMRTVLANKYGVNSVTIGSILRGKLWKNITLLTNL